MLAMQAEPFDSPDYMFEIKWDGYRGLAYLDNKTVLLSRNQIDMTLKFPELQTLHNSVKQKQVILDGEIVVLQAGKPSFSALQTRGKVSDPLRVKGLSIKSPAIFVVFDLLFLAGNSILNEPLTERKKLLEQVVDQGPNLIISQYVLESGIDFFQSVSAAGLEGVMAKRLDSPYLAGKRSSAWKKIRSVRAIELAVGGWEKGEGSRYLGALILVACNSGKWIYMGKVGTGFNHNEEIRLLELLKPLTIAKPVFIPPRGEFRRPTWVKPQLVCEVNYSEISHEGRLRHPSYKGLRFDKLAEECTLDITT